MQLIECVHTSPETHYRRRMTESFEEFKNSFSYGSRSDLSFKFLKSLSDDAAMEFFRRLLLRVGDLYDTGDATEIIELAYQAQIDGYAPDPDRPSRWRYEDHPFTALSKPLAECRVGMLTSSGHFVAGDDPRPFDVADMSQQEAEERIGEFLREAPILSAIPRDTPGTDLRVRHGGYDIRSAERDFNVTFPRDALVAAATEGTVGAVASTLYSFPGATAQGRLKQAAPGWAQRLKDEDIDVLLLVPV